MAVGTQVVVVAETAVAVTAVALRAAPPPKQKKTKTNPLYRRYNMPPRAGVHSPGDKNACPSERTSVERERRAAHAQRTYA